MRFWFDTEFIEDGRTIDLVSIGIVAEDGREYYAVSKEFNRVNFFGNEWLAQNVAPHLPWSRSQEPLTWVTAEPDFSTGYWKTRAEIAYDILNFCNPQIYDRPEFWAYYADYDWVALCQLFGRMIDLPRGWPRYCRDIKQEADRKQEVLRVRFPKYRLQLPEQIDSEHHALADARWNKIAWEYLENRVAMQVS